MVPVRSVYVEKWRTSKLEDIWRRDGGAVMERDKVDMNRTSVVIGE
jgi:hypothetical protein